MAAQNEKIADNKKVIDLCDAKRRICLRCEEVFDSVSRANRICPRCARLKSRN